MRASGNAYSDAHLGFSNIVNLIVSFILIFGAGLGVLGVSIGILVSRYFQVFGLLHREEIYRFGTFSA